jgi:DNA-binding transcriptional regulator GbsR (MarR family)
VSIEHKTSVIALNLIKKDLTNEVSIAMIDDAIKIINEAEATEKAYEELKQELKELSSLQNRNKDIVKIIYGDWGFPKFRDLEKEYLQNEFKILHYDFDKLSKVGVEE